MSDGSRQAEGRLLTFEVGAVMNHHGDALLVVERAALLPTPDGELPAPQHLLVLAESPDDACRYGLPVDCIQGLVGGEGGTALGEDAIAERRPVEGRVVSVLDPKRLLARAVEVIERSVVEIGQTHGG